MKILFFIWIFSPFGIYSIARKQQAPCDESNRINKIILLWFVFTRYKDVLMLDNVYQNGGISITLKYLSQWEMIWLATTKERSFSNHFEWLKEDMWELLQ